MSNDFQTLIIGAGPAGTAAAIQLRKHGISTCLCDRAFFPRWKSCGGLLETETFRAVEASAAGALLTRYSGLDILMPEGPLQPYPAPTVLIDRTRFDLARLRYCQQAGTNVKEGYAAVAVRHEKNRVVTLFGNGREITSCSVIAADGAASLVRRQLQMPPCATGVTMQTEIPTEAEKPQRPLIQFIAEFQGYGWIFPGGGRLNVGIYGLCGKGVKKVFEEFLDRQGLPRYSGKGGIVLLHQDAHIDAGRSRVLLAGDAAGLANPLTGGGIRAALYSGWAAAASLLKMEAEQALSHYRQLLARYTERPFNQLDLARLFYQHTRRHRTYQDGLAAALAMMAARHGE